MSDATSSEDTSGTSGLPAAAPSTGWGVLHLFGKSVAADGPAVAAAIAGAVAGGTQVVTAALLGHRADVCVMALAPDLRRLLALQSALERARLALVWSYVSLTEVSEYAAGVPDELKEARLHPVLPPEGKPAFCFYPMSKRRGEADNWYRLDYETRLELMRSHGDIGRQFKGRVLQVVTGSTGLDDYEWGVTLFGESPDDLKDCVYRMRFDEGSARYGEFGPFFTGVVGTVEHVLTALGKSAEPPAQPAMPDTYPE